MPQFKYRASGTYVIASQGTGTGAAGYQVTVTPRESWVGSLVFKQNIAPPGSTAVYTDVAYQDADTAEEVAAGTAITATAALIISPTVGDLVVVYTHTAGEIIINVNPATTGVTNKELMNAFTAAGYSTAGQDTTEAMLSVAVADMLGETLNVKAFGAVGDGVTDDTAAIQAAFNAADGRMVLFPAGDTFLVTDALSLPNNVPLQIDGTIKAGAAMDAVIQTPLATQVVQGRISGVGYVDCNNLATIGVDLRYFATFAVHGIAVLRPALKGFRLGDPTAPSTSYEASLIGVYVYRRAADGAIPAGSIGIHSEYAADGQYIDCVIVGSETGIKHDLSNNRTIACHAWAFAATGSLHTAFDDDGNGNGWVECYADTPSTYGFRIRGFNTRILGGTVYVGPFGGVDNTVIGVYHDQATAFNTIVGLHFSGSSPSLRLASDIGGAGSTASVIIHSCQYTNTVLQTPAQYSVPDRFEILDGPLVVTGSANDNNRNITFATEGDTRWRFGFSGGAESGGNANGNLRFAAHDDAGIYLRDLLDLRRSDGLVTIRERININVDGVAITGHYSGAKTHDWPSLASGAQQSTTVTVTGATVGSVAHASMTTALSGTRLWAEVTATDTVTVYHRNDTGAPVDVASGTLRAVVWVYG